MQPGKTDFSIPACRAACRPVPFEAFQKGKGPSGEGKGLPETKTNDAPDAHGNRWLRCRQCRANIARPGDRIRVNGRLSHVFNNPSGYVFEIGCFAAAAGCVNQGQPTQEFTWFAGYSWRFALCGMCRAHLGWFYQSAKGSSFYGLILANLVEEAQDPGNT